MEDLIDVWVVSNMNGEIQSVHTTEDGARAVSVDNPGIQFTVQHFTLED